MKDRLLNAWLYLWITPAFFFFLFALWVGIGFNTREVRGLVTIAHRALSHFAATAQRRRAEQEAWHRRVANGGPDLTRRLP